MTQKIALRASELTFSLLALFVALFYLSIAFDGGVHNVIQAVLAFAFVLAAFLWRTKPLFSSLLMMALLYAWSFNWISALPTNLGLTPFILSLPIAIYGVSRYVESKWTVTGIAVLAFFYCFISPIMWQPSPDGTAYRSLDQAISWLLIQWLALSVILQFGRAERRQEQQQELERLAKEQSNIDRLKQFQNQERMQVAREIHDVLAHSLTLINVQASAGEMARKASGEKGSSAQDEALRNIRKISSDSLVEVRGIVRALRDNTHESSNEGLIDLRNIPSQIEKFSASGLDIEVNLPSSEEIQQLTQSTPVITQLAVHRIIDESLTNALRHQGPGTHVTVTLSLSCEANELYLSITSKSGGEKVKPFEGTGSGLIGMEERITNLGGHITFEQNNNIFSVTATLPIQLTWNFFKNSSER